jgi:hypothetical protein
VTAAVAEYNAQVPAGITARSHAQVTALFGGLPLMAPGVVPVSQWRPAGPGHAAGDVAADIYAGLATTGPPPITAAGRSAAGQTPGAGHDRPPCPGLRRPPRQR